MLPGPSGAGLHRSRRCPAAEWDLVLCLDTREPEQLRTVVRAAVAGIAQVQMHGLPVGDVLWVALPPGVTSCMDRRAVLQDFVIEVRCVIRAPPHTAHALVAQRKRVDDLVTSHRPDRMGRDRLALQQRRMLGLGFTRTVCIIEACARPWRRGSDAQPQPAQVAAKAQVRRTRVVTRSSAT